MMISFGQELNNPHK